MNVNGIGAAGYPAWQGARKAENNAKGDFGANVKATGNVVHITPDALFSIYDAKTGESANVYKANDVSKVDPKNCDTAEMYAYTANLKESGKGSFEDTVLKAVVAKSVKDAESRSGTWSFSEKFDWTKIVNDLMESSYHYGDLKGYMEWKKFLGFLDK
jgi:hypothetical protein